MRASEVLSPLARSPDEVRWDSLGLDGEAATRTVIGTDHSRTLGAGFARFEDIVFEWKMDYDEVLYVIDGDVTVDYDGGSARGRTGDVVYVPRGNAVTYRFVGRCNVFFATYPVDWEHADG